MRVIQASCMIAPIDVPRAYAWGTIDYDVEAERAIKSKKEALEKALHKDNKEEVKKAPVVNKIYIGNINVPKFNLANNNSKSKKNPQ